MKQIIILATMLITSTFLEAQTTKTVELSYSLSDFVLSFESGGNVAITSQNYNAVYKGDTLLPALPYVGVNVIVEGTEFYAGHNYTIEKVLVGDNVSLGYNPVALPTNVPSPPDAQQNETSFSGTGLFPASTIEYEGSNDCGDYKILSFLVCPFEYDATNRHLSFMEQITLNVELSQDSQTFPATSNACFRKTAEEMIGKSAVSTFDVGILEAQGTGVSHLELQTGFEYLIVTSEAQKSAFQKLADWKSRKGIRSKILTVEEIAANYDDTTKIEKIKHAIADVDGLSYVLLGGDTLNVPTCISYIGDYNKEMCFSPADSYYACLGTLSWDGNGNGVYGEIDDSVSIVPVLSVARIPSKDVEEAMGVVNRIITYESAPDTTDWKDNILMCGTSLGYTDNNGRHQNYYFYDRPVAGDSISDTQYWSEKIYSESIEPYWNGQRTRYYDTHTDFDGDGAYDLTGTLLQSELAKGYTFVDVMTHGWYYSWSMEVSSYTWYSASRLENTGNTVVTTTACLTNAFDYSYPYKDKELWCLSRHLINNPESGVLAYWGTSRENWYYIGSTLLGPGAKFDADTYKRLFEDPYHRMGKAVQAVKQDFMALARTFSSRNRWIWMSLNLMGDPEMPVYVEKPKTFQNVEIEIVNDSLFVDTGVENFDICMINREDSTQYYIARGVQGPSAAFGRLDGSYSVSITKPGYIPYIAEAEEVTYLQNMTLANNRSYKSPNVMIGSDVTDRIEYGPVVVETGNTTVTASESVTISKDFEVKKGATFTIINQ
ncbi:MAG: hypothetical protein IJ551_01625 [Prevotella sp.]|nr:hypothetical protein [Prevotella sp.]